MQNDLFSMEGKTVVFTGGCGNLGKVMVKALLDYGANVAVPNRSDKFDETYDAYKNLADFLEEGRLSGKLSEENYRKICRENALKLLGRK